MTTIDDLRETEKRLRAADSSMYASLRTKRAELDTAAADDVAAASAALLAGETVPKPKAVKLHAEVRDIESRQLLAVDDALWRLVEQVVDVVEPNVDRRILTKNLLRWQPPDPKNPNVPAQTQHLKRRPADVVGWVLSRIAVVERSQAEQRAKDKRAELKRIATEKVNAAQAEYHRQASIAYAEEEAAMSVTARAARRVEADRSQQPLWPPFDRLAFLQREGLEADYGWTQRGVIVQGGREIPVEQVADTNPTNSTPA